MFITVYCTINPNFSIYNFLHTIYIFFWLSFEDNCIAKILAYFDLEDEFDTIVWIERKRVRHFGFILEAAMESLPQSIIQLIAIVYYQDTEFINAISSFFSLTYEIPPLDSKIE